VGRGIPRVAPTFGRYLSSILNAALDAAYEMSGDRSTQAQRKELSSLTSFSETVFLLACTWEIIGSKGPVELVSEGDKHVLSCERPEFQLDFDPVYQQVAQLLKSFGATRVGRYWSTPSPAFEVDFESQFSLEKFANSVRFDELQAGIKSIVVPQVHEVAAGVECSLDVTLDFFQVLPNKETRHAVVQRVNVDNCSTCVSLWNEKVVFDFLTELKGRDKQHETEGT